MKIQNQRPARGVLVADWRRVLARAWSLRLLIIAAVLQGLEAAIPYLGGFVPEGVMLALSFIATAGAFAARLMAQKELSR
ncbi:hypothetical protein [Pseudovibrio exalbescens]|uniref:Uncharacterized protein n=1 Tax=Pseudovibrio exalbescens TaxID=197461 RepID=A0A1U7JK23_9HYPH|nr:hypothetical protein [Pseudovibrio exalbescens]OKL45001.1 hypothetical protein A3843_05295 [Pseudovibrio exalbescens]